MGNERRRQDACGGTDTELAGDFIRCTTDSRKSLSGRALKKQQNGPRKQSGVSEGRKERGRAQRKGEGARETGRRGR